MSESIKLAHFISLCGVSSRRRAELLIIDKRIKVNGLTEINCARRITSEDKILLDDQEINYIESRLFMLNKPIKYLVSHVSQDDKKTIFDLIPLKIHLTYVGRLDYMSEGLLLLTNNPSLANHLTTNSFARRYLVTVNRICNEFQDFLNDPSSFGYNLKPIILNKITYIKHNIIELDLILYEGKNREIRKICEMFDIIIYRLERIEYGPFKCDIDIGEFKEIINFDLLL